MKPGTVAVGFLDPGHWSHCFGQSLIDLYLGDAFGSRRLIPDGRQMRVLCHAGGIVAGRNEVAEQFLETECEWLFLIDSDMGFAADTVDRLIASAGTSEPRPVVGGLCFSLRRDTPGEFYGMKYVVVPTCFEFVDTPDEVGFRSILDYPRDTLMEVSGTGAACLMVHRSAVEAVKAKFGPVWFDQITHPTGPTTFSEDLSFCVRLASCDIPVLVDTSVRTTHDKHGVFLDEDEFDRCQALHRSPALLTEAV